ncbi:hypothetical protein RIVM261_038480 [Rivularia sp. IAM M-261]|nr:hypothetical protein RIVM261_038480 [Rivularia sp. IAM M-261]
MLSTASAIQLSSIQQELLEKIENHYRSGKKSCLLFLPTGGGKTVVAADLIARWVQNGKRILFCCHRTKLVGQTVDKLQRFYGIASSVIHGANPVNYKAPVQVAMLQTLSNRDLPPDIDLVIFDEAHTTSYWGTTYNIMHYYSGGVFALSKCKFLGLTGSPWRTKQQQGFCQFYDSLVVGPYLDELATLGEVTPVRHFGWGGLIDYSKLTMGADDYTAESLELVCDATFNEKVVLEYKRHYGHLNSVVFCGTVKQATDVYTQLNNAGLRAGLIVGTTSSKERDDLYEQYNAGIIKALVGVSVFTEGFDAPICNAAVLAYPTASLSKLYQMSGRPTRKYTGKTYAYLLDFCDNFSRLGFVTEHHPISLCPIEKEPQTFEPKLKSCPQCNALINRYARVCECGYIYSKCSNLAAEIKSRSRKPDFSQYGELLTVSERHQVAYLRRKLHNIINKGSDPSLVVRIFFEHYRKVAPVEWFLGAVFDGDKSPAKMQVWYDYLKRVRPFGDEWWYQYWMEAEFGNKAVNFNNNSNWCEYFECGADATWEEVFESYRMRVVSASENDVVNANVMLTYAAVALKQWDYVNTFTANRARVSGIQMKMLQLASDVIAAIKECNVVKLKTLINQDLHLWQSAIKYLTHEERIQLTNLLKSYNNEAEEIFTLNSNSVQPTDYIGSWCLLNDNRTCLIIKFDSSSGHFVGMLGDKYINFGFNSIELIVTLGLNMNNEKLPTETPPSWSEIIAKQAPPFYKLLDKLYIFANHNQTRSELELFASSIIYKRLVDDLFNGLLAPIASILKPEADNSGNPPRLLVRQFPHKSLATNITDTMDK